ncbi:MULTISPECIES: CGNR zinc finger domain-containing protein [unclassified Streptomyces]|uniref:CGNR zinc finger domain-containing protein n=1 Tax=unclassified Streptomyces TaxID=2593676 RepID=UPI0016554D08|nr:CGNR zinc finger domain-containing protein [Streptomyces sp. CB02980]MCB8905291.1 CGNR zinc finger domain-containing protein [Streptomyces sp. CB02980]
MTAIDPRPLVGEPVALDLLNTRWNEEGVRQDLLAGVEGLTVWLAANGLDERFTADATTLRHTLTARDALAALVDRPGDPAATARVDFVLGHGRIRATLTAEGPGERPEFADPAWGPGWTAARDYLDLLRTAPDRIRACAHEACILHFFDTSRNGTRRWCSMAVCGNRAKASRHYARTKES